MVSRGVLLLAFLATVLLAVEGGPDEDCDAVLDQCLEGVRSQCDGKEWDTDPCWQAVYPCYDLAQDCDRAAAAEDSQDNEDGSDDQDNEDGSDDQDNDDGSDDQDNDDGADDQDNDDGADDQDNDDGADNQDNEKR